MLKYRVYVGTYCRAQFAKLDDAAKFLGTIWPDYGILKSEAGVLWTDGKEEDQPSARQDWIRCATTAEQREKSTVTEPNRCPVCRDSACETKSVECGR